MADSILEFDDVEVRYDGACAVCGVSLAIARDTCLAVVGESGSGKTTLLRLVQRLVEPSRGRVLLHGADIALLDAVTTRRRIGYVPQDAGLLPHWRVLRNVGLLPRLLGHDAATADTAAAEALERVGLPAATFGARWPHELSGGQRQRAAVARALASRPELILMDEPFGALDAITRSDAQAMFAELRAQAGMTAILVTHDMVEALRLSDIIAVLRAGRIEQLATPAELQDAPATAYVKRLLERATATLDAPT